ncbi:hypothetical protein G210_5629 [Candida maltosa Xu316]|uniref:F-box domain-containing protein n=1 Tax=Candida maltosa (strain Xu316) TaxID=1245528 RepID=M3HQ20_CANMX|nr:hypothetical protein G210_5629 [Candida maltosa Xu316]
MTFDEDDVIRNIHKLPNELIDLIFSFLPACALDELFIHPPLVCHVANYIAKKVDITGYDAEEFIQEHSNLHCRDPDHTMPSFVKIDDFIDFCQEYRVSPKEVTMSVEEIDRDDVSFLKLCSSIRLWGIIAGEEEYQFRRDKFEQLNVHELNFEFPENLFNPGFVATFPKALRYLRIETGKILGNEPVFKQFQFLENLTLQKASMDILRCLPPSLSRLSIGEFYVDRDSSTIDPELPSLKVFEVFIIFCEPGWALEPVFRQMPNLEKFLATETNVANFADLSLPTSLKCISLSRITTFDYLTEYENLRELGLYDCKFPVEAFKDANTFPNMFKFVYYGTRRPSITVDHLVFPKNLQILQLSGKIIIERWTLPKSLRRLGLTAIDIGDNFEFDFPSSVYHLEIRNTQLQGLDNVTFPSELTILRITDNKHLQIISVINLFNLERLIEVNIFSNAKLERNDFDQIIYPNQINYRDEIDDVNEINYSDDSDDTNDMDDSDDSDAWY